MKISLKEIYLEFFLLGVQLLGGGYVIVPLMKQSLIEKHHWITEEELINFYALSQSLPGIIAANISIFTGYKLRGKSGAFISLLGIITSPIISIIAIASIVDVLLKLSVIKSLFWGIGIAVTILIYLTIKEIWGNSIKTISDWIILLLTFIAAYFLEVSPVYIIIFAVVYGLITQKIRGEK